MAMATCKECGGAVSTKAGVCPHCGAKIKRTSGVTWLVLGFLVIVGGAVLGPAMRGSDDGASGNAQKAAALPGKTPEQVKAEAAEKAKQEAEFQRVVAVARAVKAGMKNPASFELVNAIYMPDGTVCLTYRGTNSFNAVVTQNTGVDAKGKVVTWNAKCGGKTGNDYRAARMAVF